MKCVKRLCKSLDVKAVVGTEFQAYLGQNKIEYNFGQTELEEFWEYVTMMYPDIKANIWTWVLLHEVGHLKTKQNINKALSKYIWKNIDRFNLPTKAYFYDPDEVIATNWAANYIKKHQKKIKKFEKKLRARLGEKIWNMYVDTE